MSDFRYDPVFGNWVCIAETRQQRPVEYQQIVQRRPDLTCPFCRGNEDQTPPSSSERHGRNGWLVRAFPNKYPALMAEDSACDNGDPERPRGGQQEVIVVSPRHVAGFGDLHDNEISAGMNLFQERVAHYEADPGIQHVALFMNCRPLAGASIEHAHWQVVGSPLVSRQVAERISRTRAGAFEEIVRREQHEKLRLVQETDRWTIYCPHASRFAGQVRFVARDHRPFIEMPSRWLDELGESLARMVRLLDRALEEPAYNIVFFLPPTGMSGEPWFVDLIPRFPQMAGFELATDCWINPLSPETAAGKFRQHF
jgi:UDPglucose--hexose-1-phosphate uridylyltransferase